MHKLIGYVPLWITLVVMQVFDMQLTRMQQLVITLVLAVIITVLYYTKPRTKEDR